MLARKKRINFSSLGLMVCLMFEKPSRSSSVVGSGLLRFLIRLLVRLSIVRGENQYGRTIGPMMPVGS